jgi:hypothetical protein
MPIGARRPRGTEQLSELKQSVRRLLDLDDDTTVMVSQLACSEPGCPPLETVIAVLPMDGSPRRWALHRSVDQVTEDDLQTGRPSSTCSRASHAPGRRVRPHLAPGRDPP